MSATYRELREAVDRCTCGAAEQVKAAHAVKLQEPLPAGPLETFASDDCCTSRLMRAMRSGDRWACPNCGAEWTAEMVGQVRHWTPVCDVQIFRTN